MRAPGVCLSLFLLFKQVTFFVMQTYRQQYSPPDNRPQCVELIKQQQAEVDSRLVEPVLESSLPACYRKPLTSTVDLNPRFSNVDDTIAGGTVGSEN